MRKTNLAYIDSRMNHLIQAELKSPTPHVEHSTQALKPRVIAGFEVNDRKLTGRLLDEAREKRQQVVKRYVKQKKALLEEFQSIGVEPLAVLPTVTFESICKASDLYFVPKRMRSGVNPVAFLSWVYDVEPASDGIMTAMERIRRVKPKVDKTVEGYMKLRTHGQLIRELMTGEPTQTDIKPTAEVLRFNRRWSSDVDGAVWDLLLPVPPEEVAEKLIRAADADMELRTVAVYDAIDFVGGIKPILHRVNGNFEDYRQEEQERIDWIRNDPIVYVPRGTVTAVVAQFGPFPIEQEIVDKVTAADFLPPSIE